jgi:uncharacterized protein DUF5674
MASVEPILVVSKPLPRTQLARFIGNPFPEMVKFVADLDRRLLAVGGELHADAEEILIESGSRQESLWGGNYHPGLGEGECVEFESLINIRPSLGNQGMTVQDSRIRARIRELVFALLGRGEALP